jgi:hypothetical protein
MNIPARLRASLLAVVGLASVASLPAQDAPSRPANRIATDANMAPMTRLTGHLPRWVSSQTDAGAVPDETPIQFTMLLSRSPERELAFTQLLIDQQNPSSPRYHQWLTPSQIGEQFGPSTDDVAVVTQWLTARGMKVTSVAPSRIFVEVSSTTGIVGAALSTSFHRFMLDGESRLSATTEPAIPTALAVAVGSIDGLTEIPVRPLHITRPAEPIGTDSGAHPMYSGSNNTVHYVFPGDFAKIYDIEAITGAGFTGTGVRVAIIGRSQVASADITQLQILAGLPTKIPNIILAGADPGQTNDDDQEEATLDVDRVLTTATGAQADLVIASTKSGGVTAAMQYNVNTLLDPVMTISFGACETSVGLSNTNFLDNLYKQGVAEGISTFVSSGDSGAAGCAQAFVAPPTSPAPVRNINAFCSSSYVTCVGGTEFNDTAAPGNYWSPTTSSTYTSALGYIQEGAWNEPTPDPSSGITTYVMAGTGGGASTFISKPTWQTGIGVPTDGARDTPDISFTSAAHDGYYACLAYKTKVGNCSPGVIFSGTSAAAPGMAAVAAILVQKTGNAQGNMNPALYSLAATTPAAFHDATPATSGVSSCSVGTVSMCNNSTPTPNSPTGGLAGYPLQVGYDLATGLGSLDVFNFITAASGPVLIGTTTTVTASPSTVVVGGSTVLTATVAGSGSTALTGTVQFYLNGASLGPQATVAGGKASTTATFTVTGTYSINVIYSGDSNYAASTSATLPFVVTLPATTTTLTANPATILVGRTATFTATVAVASGTAATGTVQFSSNGGALGSPVTLFGGTATTPSTTFTSAGTYSITATYSGDSKNAPSTSLTLSFVVSPLPATTTIVTAAPAAITTGGTAVFTAVVSSSTATGTVQFLSNGTALGSAIALSGGRASTASTQFTTPGTYAITAVYSGDTNNAGSTSAAISFVVTAATVSGLTATATPTTLSVTAGAGSGNTSTIALATTASFYGNVSLSCGVANSTGTIYPPTCTFSPATVTFSGTTTGSSVLTLGTTAPRAVPGGLRTRNSSPFVPIGGLSLASLLLVLIPASRRRKIGWLAILPLVLLGAITGCGSSGANTGPSTPVGTTKGSYVITVTATPSAGTAATATITLTVQ